MASVESSPQIKINSWQQLPAAAAAVTSCQLPVVVAKCRQLSDVRCPLPLPPSAVEVQRVFAFCRQCHSCRIDGNRTNNRNTNNSNTNSCSLKQQQVNRLANAAQWLRLPIKWLALWVFRRGIYHIRVLILHINIRVYFSHKQEIKASNNFNSFSCIWLNNFKN